MHILTQFMMNYEISKDSNTASCYVQTYGLKQGINKFGSKGKDAVCKVLNQLHNQEVIKPILLEYLSEQ